VCVIVMARLVVPCVGLFLGAMVMAFMPMIVMPRLIMPSLSPMIMRARGTEILPKRPLRRQKPQLLGGGSACQRPVQPRRHLWPDPDHQPGLLQTRRLRGAQLKRMGVGPLFQQEIRLAQIAHHLRHQGMHRGNVGHHPRHLGHRRRGNTGQQKRYDITHDNGLLFADEG
ncbi:MAG: hypothetical protein RI979_1773, partial [Pseudomonadota bacterium]